MLLLLSLVPMPARANDGPPPSFQVAQQGPDVVVTLRLADAGEPGFGDPIDVLRDGQPVVRGAVWTEQDAEGLQGRCWGRVDPEECAASGDCLDCDEDGVPECALSEFLTASCYREGSVEVVESCVREGWHTWEVTGSDHSEELKVAADASCSEGGDDAGSGCSVVGPLTVPWATGLGLLVVGLLGLRRTR